MVGNMIKKTCLPVVVVIMIALLLSGCAVEYEVKLEAEPEDAGTVTGSGAYREGETVTIKAEAEEGYTFDRWKVKGTELEHSDKKTELKVEEDKELVAEFSRKTHTINLECDIERDSLTGGGTFEYGETVEVEAKEIVGYWFKKWLEDDEVVSEDKTYQFTADENRTLTAVRELDLEELVLKDDLKGYILTIIENGKYGFVGREVIKMQYDRATDFVNEAAGVIKDGKLSFIDREGNQLVEPVDVDYNEDYRFQLRYLEGPEVYYGRYGDTINYNYFDLEGWIWKP